MATEPLSDSTLRACTSLPEKPLPVVLEGRHVRLVPLDVERDAQPLFAMCNGTAIVLGDRSCGAYDADALIWRYMFDGPFATAAELAASLQQQVAAPNALCFCVFDVASGKQVGVANLLNNSPAHLKIELGGIWYSPIVQGTCANSEATYLMLQHVFQLGYRRAEWKCHAANERSRRAALRLGFTFEGIQEWHMILNNGKPAP